MPVCPDGEPAHAPLLRSTRGTTVSISTLFGTSGELVLIPASNVVCFRQFRTDRVASSGRERPVNVGEYVRGVAGDRRIVRGRRADYGDPASSALYQRHDPAGMTEVVRSVLAGRAPRPALARGYASTGRAPRPHRSVHGRICGDQVGSLGFSRSRLGAKPGLQNQIPLLVDVDASPAGDAVKIPAATVARGGVSTVTSAPVLTSAAIPAESIPSFAAAAAQSSDSLVAREIDGDAGERSRAVVVQPASRSLTASSAIVAKATSCKSCVPTSGGLCAGAGVAAIAARGASTRSTAAAVSALGLVAREAAHGRRLGVLARGEGDGSRHGIKDPAAAANTAIAPHARIAAEGITTRAAGAARSAAGVIPTVPAPAAGRIPAVPPDASREADGRVENEHDSRGCAENPSFPGR